MGCHSPNEDDGKNDDDDNDYDNDNMLYYFFDSILTVSCMKLLYYTKIKTLLGLL